MHSHWLRGLVLWSLCCIVQVKSTFKEPKCIDTKRCSLRINARPGGNNDCVYEVDGNKLEVYRDSSGFSMECHGNLTLDNAALPRLERLTSFRRVEINNCTSQYSYSDALRRINIKPLGVLAITTNEEVTSEHLTGLDPSLQSLKFTNAIFAPDTFKYTTNITRMSLNNIKPFFNQLPKSLTQLILNSPGTAEFQHDDLRHLSNLHQFSVYEDVGNVTVKAVSPLRILTLSAELVFLDAELAETLDTVTIINWGELKPLPWKNCQISSLSIRNAHAQTLPDGWLANCSNLTDLTLEAATSLTSVENDPFRGAISLTRVNLIRSGLLQLSSTLLYDATQLQFLDLSGNFLHNLSEDFFQKSLELKKLDLSKNNLTYEVIRTISSIPKLKVLDLNDNTRLGRNICEGFRVEGLYNLATLNLHNTNVKHVCIQWREKLTSLKYLNLSANNITDLQFADLRFSHGVEVDLRDNDIKHLQYTYGDYDTLDDNRCKKGADGSQPPDASHATNIKLNSTLQCGCNEAWTALAFQNCPNHVHLVDATCVGGTELVKTPLEILACPVEPKYCPKDCRCDQIVRAEDPKRVIRVWCENGYRTELPYLSRNNDVAWKLYLANNSISNPSEKDLPPNVLELDLRYNGITQVDVVTSLLGKNGTNRTSTSRILRLGGNKLDCSCGTEQQLKVLVDSSAQVGDFQDLECSDGARLVVTANCSRGIIVGLILGLTPLILVVIIIIVGLARPKTRKQIKIILRGLGCLPHPTEPDEGQPYDVFLSFSQLDFEVARRLQAWIEINGYKTIVHYRDWAPGAWIPAQIEASVRLSKRTVAVVSKNFLESTWAPVEFRQAYGAAMLSGDRQPRLVVILLEDLSSLNLDHPSNNLLRRHLASNTYLMWNDVWFWAKLRASLPPRQHIGLWRKLCSASFPCGTQVDSEVDPATISMLPLPRRSQQAEAVARAMAELNREAKPEARAVVEAVMDGMQPQDHIANDLQDGRTARS